MNILAVVLFVAAALAYFVPSIVAGAREARNQTGIFILNLVAGWTVLGWIAALAWAVAGAADDGKRTAVCSFCAERMMPAAKICPHCRSEIVTPAPVAA